ncbi:hypothetical protein FACS189498_3950 [Spirochaetia bacterium]|nr:hypothetical protein FACS189498_3950 [Spirochaetia bacterium]
MKKKPFKIMAEHLKSNYIEIELFRKKKSFSFSISTFIDDGGIGIPDTGPYQSYFEAKNAALHRVLYHHKSIKQLTILKKFRLMEDIDQPYLFDYL